MGESAPAARGSRLPQAGDPKGAWLLAAIFWAVGAGAWLLVAGAALYAERTLRNGSVVTGYALFAVMLMLGLFTVRKRLLVLPVGTARSWMILHGVLGMLAIPLYLQHAGGLWPRGLYEQAIAATFYFATVSGIAGYVIERLLPRRLAHLGGEVIYERIPAELAALRERAETLVLKAVEDTGSDTLGRYYAESFDWYFWRPRFLVGHVVGSQRAQRWIQDHLSALRRYLSERERAHLDELETIAVRKSQLDAHYALQSVLKLWLFVHLPSAVLLIGLSIWHLLVVNIYAL